MPKVRRPKCLSGGSEKSLTSLVTSPGEESSFDYELCVKCNGPVSTDFFECIWCERWQHCKCVNISTEKSSNLRDLPINIAFFCCQCVSKLPFALNSYDKANEACSNIDRKLNSMQENLTNSVERWTKEANELSKLSEDAEKFTKVLPKNSKPPKEVHQNKDSLSVHSIASMTADTVLEEKEKRKLNLIIHHIPEFNLEPQDQKEDIDNLAVLFNKHVGIPASVTNTIRIGKKTNRPRLIKVTLSSREEKISILRSRRNLRNKDHPTHVNKVFITPDLTPLQQRTNKHLRIELAELSKSNKCYIIKQGKIIRREMFPPRK